MPGLLTAVGGNDGDTAAVVYDSSVSVSAVTY
jgi:hypothetical protein